MSLRITVHTQGMKWVSFRTHGHSEFDSDLKWAWDSHLNDYEINRHCGLGIKQQIPRGLE